MLEKMRVPFVLCIIVGCVERYQFRKIPFNGKFIPNKVLDVSFQWIK